MGKRGRLVAAPLPMYVRRRPTLPQPLGCSTIGAERLNFRVRYGTGCFPFAMAAVTLAEHTHPTTPVVGVFQALGDTCSVVSVPHKPSLVWGGFVVWELHVDAGTIRVRGDVLCTVLGQALGLLVPVGWALLLYTSGLSTQCSAGDLTYLCSGKPHLETCFPLRCIQRLSLPNVANQPCSWQNNWHTRGSSIPVLSY